MEGRRPSRALSDPPGSHTGHDDVFTSVHGITLAAPFQHDPESGRYRQGSHSKDDHDAFLPSTPRQPRGPRGLLARGLTLQLPAQRLTDASPQTAFAVPLSPKLDAQSIYMQSQSQSHSPATSLPRHSRGLDFSRACTTLAHSTLAESSPDSSPVIGQRGVNIPGRKMSFGSMALDSPNLNGPSTNPWSTLAPERSTVSSSVGSINMLASDSDSTTDDEDASMGGDDGDDPLLTTPQVHKLHNPGSATPFNTQSGPGSGSIWGTGAHFSPAQASLVKTIRKQRLSRSGRRTRQSSSSASGSGYSSMASPRTTSPPPMRSIESGGLFGVATAARSRRESLALGTDGLHLSSGNDSGDEASGTNPSTPGVVRRPVTRRGNLLPKTKGFARIRAALMEEAAPVDTDVRREAETIRQVRERDNSTSDFELTPATAASSPNLLPAVPEAAQEDFGKELDGETPIGKGSGSTFALHASRNSGGVDYWNRFDPSLRTPPPPAFNRHGSNVSEINLDSPFGEGMLWRRPRARSSASDASEAFHPLGNSSNNNGGPTSIANDDMHLKKFKRRRDDDFDITTIKRRAVSPGMSAQNSPVLTASPSHRDLNAWGQPPESKTRRDLPSSSSNSDIAQLTRGSSGGSSGMSVTPSGSLTPNGNLVNQGKKVGLQPMADTNDGLMKMSIE